jgi:hypothetical protein
MLSHLATARSHWPIMLLHADHSENEFALRGQIRDDIAALPNASVYVWYEQTPKKPFPGCFTIICRNWTDMVARLSAASCIAAPVSKRRLIWISGSTSSS